MKQLFSILLLGAFLAGCEAPTPAAPATKPIPYRLDSKGIQLIDRPQRVDFGRTDHSTIGAMTKLVGRGPVEQGFCGEVQRVRWPDGTTLYFQRGDFRGWSLDGETPRRTGVTC